MLNIKKGQEPRSLTEHRAQGQDNTYQNYREKDELRASLVNEQRHLCCYCMSRIKATHDGMKIEHWQSQTRFSDRQLDYDNLLGACRGGEGKPKSQQYCDTQKGDRDLKWNPADRTRSIEDWIKYGVDGTISARDPELNAQLGTDTDPGVLNLNLAIHKNRRRAALDGIFDWWKKEKARIKTTVPKATLERKLSKIQNRSELRPYSGVQIQWLSKKIAKMS